MRSLLFFLLTAASAQTPYTWDLPAGFPKPRVPDDNPMTAEKVELGRYLFYDRRLSSNGTQSCASCHVQSLAFTDGKPRGEGSTGERHPRGSMSLVNVAYTRVFTWIDQDLHSLEEQARLPMFGDHPIELGVTEKSLALIRADPRYQKLFGAEPITTDNIIKALACFERSIVSARSPYDRYHFDRDESAISAAAKHGEVLFFSTGFSCFRCHSGPNFTGKPDEEGGFKAPTLRNIAVTAPYMHDGNVKTLDEAILHHVAMSDAERTDILEFLRTLTDEPLLHDPRFANPFREK
ncbi:MAG TPA: cytochrome c peroxidase [Bryobacteraceae bacterium]|nr:cytochrome c peroxidase [Bryobacteraceae bacterium]